MFGVWLKRRFWWMLISGLATHPALGLPEDCVVSSDTCIDEPRHAVAASTYLTSARVDPLCIRVGVDSFRLSIGVANPQIVSVRMSTQGSFLYQNAPISTLTLFDDGTHGDAQAADHVFSLNELSLVQTPGTIDRFVLRIVSMTFHYADGHEETSDEDLGLTLLYVASSVPIPQAVNLSSDVRATRHVVSMVEPLQGSFPGHFVDNEAISRRYYDFFPDDRDFLMIVKAFNTNGNAASFITVRNDVQGIGLSMLDRSSDFGSAGVLQGVINIYFGNARPSTMNHEILHRWAAFFDPSLDLTGSGAHWGAIAAGDTGFGGPGPYVGSFDTIEPVSENRYRALFNNSGAYGPLELYVMGLVGAEEVPSPIAALVHPDFQEFQGSYYVYTADSLRQVSTAEIVSVEGPRVPSHVDSQKLFRSALMVVYDRPLSDVELAYYDFAMQEYEKSTSALGLTFAAATGGRAAISTALPCPVGTGGPNCTSIPALDGFGLAVFAFCLLGAGAYVVRRRRV